jgi:lipid-binding SYLF domain-containing protein
MTIHTRLIAVSLIVSLAVLAPGKAQADSIERAIEIFKKSPVVQPFFETAYGYAVFPNVIKAGLFVGLSYGTGKVFRGGVPTGTSELARMSLGFQFGGKGFRQIIFFEDERAYNEFTSQTFDFGFDVNATIITVGAQASAGTLGPTAGATAGPATGVQAHSSYFRGMAVFVHAKGGLMLEASLGGQKFTFEPYE